MIRNILLKAEESINDITFRNGLLILVFLIPFIANAQDSHFSNTYSVRSYVNPALSSSYKGTLQASVSYRRQWSSLGSDFPFQSYAFHVNKKLEWQGTDEIAFELRGLKDEAPGKAFTQNQAVVGINYKKVLKDGFNSAQYISLGFSGGIGQNKANWSGLWFGNQFDHENGVPDFNIYSGEDITTLLSNRTYSDLNLGIAYEAHLPNLSLNAGVSLSHLTKPNISFAPGQEIVYNRKIISYFSFNFKVKEDLLLIFTPLYSKQGVFHEFSSKVGLTFAAPDIYDISFGIAMAPRMVQNFEGLGLESLSLQIFFEKNNYRFECAYDATLSRLSDFNGGRGAFEFSFIYTRLNYDEKSTFNRHFHFL